MGLALTILTAAALFLGADDPKLASRDSPPPSGWSIATEGSGIPVGQNADDFAAAVDRTVMHGGKAAVSLRAIVAKPAGFRSVTQFVKADAYRGKRVRLAGYLKTRDVAEWSALWLRVDGQGSMLAFDNMGSRPVKGTTDWTRHEVVLDVPEPGLRLAFGTAIQGVGQVWADDLTLEVVDPNEVKTTQPSPTGPKYAEHAANLDFEATGASVANPVPGWNVHGHEPQSYSYRIIEAGAHGGRAFLEMQSTPTGKPSAIFATQNVAAGSYKGKQVRFRAFLKTEGVSDVAYLTLAVTSKQSMPSSTTMGQGAKGTTGWKPQEAVIDVPADADGLIIAAVLRGAGTLGVDDASLEVVDPAKDSLLPETRALREKRAREMAEALAGMPDRPKNLDFEE